MRLMTEEHRPLNLSHPTTHEAEFELLKVENQLLKQQLKRETEAKEILIRQFEDLLTQYRALQMKTNQFQITDQLPLNFGLMQRISSLPNMEMKGDVKFQSEQHLSPEAETDIDEESCASGYASQSSGKRLSTTEAFPGPDQSKRSRSFAQAKQQLHNRSSSSFFSERSHQPYLGSMNNVQFLNPANNLKLLNFPGVDQFLSQGSQSAMMPLLSNPNFFQDYFSNLQRNNKQDTCSHVASGHQQQDEPSLSSHEGVPNCLLCLKKGLKCVFEGRSKVCLNCRKSKKKCERGFPRNEDC